MYSKNNPYLYKNAPVTDHERCAVRRGHCGYSGQNLCMMCETEILAFYCYSNTSGFGRPRTDCLNRNKHGRKTNLRNTGTVALRHGHRARIRGIDGYLDRGDHPPEKRWIGNLKNTAMRKNLISTPPSLHFFRLLRRRQYTRGTFDLAGAVRRLSVRRFHFGTGGGHASSESGVPTVFSPNGNPPTGSASSPATKRRRPFSPSRNLTVRTPYSKARRLRTQPPISLSILTANCWDARERPSRGR